MSPLLGGRIALTLETLSEPFPHSKTSEPAPPKTGPLPERRRHRRGRIANASSVVINETNSAVMVNLGQGGMRVQAVGRALEVGARARLQFQLPGGQEMVRVSATVAWVNDAAEAGLRFSGRSKWRARRLRAWLAKNGIATAAQELLSVGGSWQTALELMAESACVVTGAGAAAINLAGRRAICFPRTGGLSIRATVAAPIYASQAIAGHLEIASPELGAFEECDLKALQVLAAVIGEIIEASVTQPRGPARAAPPFPARIMSRLEGMLPTVRVKIVS